MVAYEKANILSPIQRIVAGVRSVPPATRYMLFATYYLLPTTFRQHAV
jgi:hypothetical protein